MDEKKEIIVTLKDGTKVVGISDGCGNMNCPEKLDKNIFTRENLSEITIEEDGSISEGKNYILRALYPREDGTFLRIDEMTKVELLKAENDELREANDMLTECILEMSEEVYGG